MREYFVLSAFFVPHRPSWSVDRVRELQRSLRSFRDQLQGHASSSASDRLLFRPDSRARTSPPRLDAWGKKQQTHGMAHPPHPSHPSEWREMTNGGGGPHFSSSGGQAGGSHSATRYKLKKQQQQRHRRRSSSPMGRVILINAPVDGEFRTWSCVSMATHTTALTVAAETCSEWPQIQVSTNIQMFQFPKINKVFILIHVWIIKDYITKFRTKFLCFFLFLQD